MNRNTNLYYYLEGDKETGNNILCYYVTSNCKQSTIESLTNYEKKFLNQEDVNKLQINN